ELLADSHYTLEAARALGRTADRHAVVPLARLLTASVESTVRVAAAALAELRQRHQERYGTSRPIEEGLRGAIALEPALRRMSRALDGADPAEQIALCTVFGMLASELAVPALNRLLDGPP